MKQIYFFLSILLFFPLAVLAGDYPANPYSSYFSEAYQLHPQLKRGILEAVAFTNTRFAHLDASQPESCTDMPQALSVMGLMQDGKGWFRNNLTTIANASGISENDIISNPRSAILAYAAALDQQFSSSFAGNSSESRKEVFQLISLTALSELPALYRASNDSEKTDVLQKRFVMDTWLYSIISFLGDERSSAAYGFQQWITSCENYFGDNYPILSAQTISVGRNTIPSANGRMYKTIIYTDSIINYHDQITARITNSSSMLSADYGPALWNPAASCNYSSRASTAISAVTIHTVQGTYAGCISWFQNCAASVSAHYVLRSSDGQITQMVLEANKAWHVGSENPYTVGLEHEGYVNNASWYTTAMYNASGTLVRDICNDNGIDPLRTGWWPWLPSTYYNQSSIPGSCTRVKGHQHYPNQTHNDPGPNWNWNYFYTIVNSPAPAATVYTAASGNFYDSGGASAVYGDDERMIWTVSPTNASSVTMTFSSFALENTWDYLFVYDGNSTSSPLLGYYTGSNSPGTITSSGGSLTFEFRSDCATTAAGWNASWTSVIVTPQNPDVISPTTSVTVAGNWQTQNFNATFAESDDSTGSGLEKSFYQVIDFDGTDWRANNSRGFFSDNFDLTSIHSDWTVATGTWQINNSVLEQNDEASGNTNIYAPLTQNLSNKYLYHWAGKIDGTGNTRRAGFHFFCDNPTGTNRGNNYFVWFRIDQSALEFYEVTNDVFALMHSVPMTTVAGQWYDWKVVYDRTTGEINVYQDNVLKGSWTDTTPYSNGQYISFRSGNANWQINNFKVYRSRNSNTSIPVTVGNCASCELRYQNTNPNTPAGRVKSLVRDSAYNISSVAYFDVNVDWTAPTSVDTLYDGTGPDIDLSTSSSILDANWSQSLDTNSGLLNYWYAIGTTPGDSNVVNWTNNWGADTMHVSNLALTHGQWYYTSVRAENSAGLVTPTYTSDGVLIDLSLGLDENNGDISINALPNPFTENTVIHWSQKTAGRTRIELFDLHGKRVLISDAEVQPGNHTFVLAPGSLGLSGGVYLLRISSGESTAQIRLLKK